jgi:hypothetical protein
MGRKEEELTAHTCGRSSQSLCPCSVLLNVFTALSVSKIMQHGWYVNEVLVWTFGGMFFTGKSHISQILDVLSGIKFRPLRRASSDTFSFSPKAYVLKV